MGLGLIISIALVISVKGESMNNTCDSSPCKNGGTCRNSDEEPYYTCVCHPEYQGTQCEEITFIISTTNNCKYHVNLRDKKLFTDTKSTCRSLGGARAMMKTAKIQNLVESQAIKQYGATGGEIGFWIGGYKDKNRWTWADGTDVPTTGKNSKWAINQHSSNGYMMFITSFRTTRENMKWHAVPNNLKKKGYICEISVVDRCLLFPCLNSGTCTSIGCQRKCQCMGGYMGENCENNVCDSSPCTNGGTCELSTKEPYYTCICQPEYRGTQCKNIRLFHDTTNNCKYHVNLYDKKSFVKTNSTCSSLGGAIAMMKTTEIQDLVESQIIKQYGATGEALEFWIGGFKVSNSWMWVDGTDVPTTGKVSKWSTNHHTSTGSMILSPHGGDRENMMWFAKPNNRKRGYICEISVVDRCLLFPCHNSGTCTQIGCQKKCDCMWGYTGENCENRVSQISCFQSGISIQWNRENHKMGRVYKLHLEDLMSKTTKPTNVQILVTEEASINIGIVSDPSPIHCFSSTRLSISPNKYILVDLWVARIRMSLKSVAKVYYIFDESKLKVELVDLS